MTETGASLAQKIREEFERLDSLEESIETLRREYEKYFSGQEKLEPAQLRRRVQRALLNSPLARSTRAEVRFRLATLVQRFSTYVPYWDRTLRQLEEGLLVREGFGRFARKPGAEAAATPPQILRTSHQASSSASTLASRSLYEAYCAACEGAGSPLQVGYDDFKRRVETTFAPLAGRKDVGLEVRVREGRVTLAAVRLASVAPVPLPATTNAPYGP